MPKKPSAGATYFTTVCYNSVVVVQLCSVRGRITYIQHAWFSDYTHLASYVIGRRV